MSMDDLIAMANQLHMSQETLSLKAQLARTLVLPMPIPSPSAPGGDGSQPLPSPASGPYAYDSFPFDAASSYSPSPSSSPVYPASYEDDAALAAAFAGDAFAPMVANTGGKAGSNPWAAFQAPPQQPQFSPPQQQHAPQARPSADAVDADMADAML